MTSQVIKFKYGSSTPNDPWYMVYSSTERGTENPDWVLKLKIEMSHGTTYGRGGTAYYMAATLVSHDANIPVVTHRFTLQSRKDAWDDPAPRVVVHITKQIVHGFVTHFEVDSAVMLWDSFKNRCDIKDICAICHNLKAPPGEPELEWAELPCGHNFHSECLEDWHKSTCPLCVKEYDKSHELTRCSVPAFAEGLQNSQQSVGGRSRKKR